MHQQNEMEVEMGVIQQEARAWVVRLDGGQVSERDAQVFRHWCGRSRRHANAFVDARAVWGAMAPAARQVRRAATPAVNPARRAWLGGAVAAGIGLLVLRPPLELWPSVAGMAADYATGTGEQRTVALDGGVVVQMNTQTRIDAPHADAVVLLAGEAEFQSGAAPLQVRAGAATVAAAGARVNIRLRELDVCITCLAGRVRVRQDWQSVELVAGEQLRLAPDRIGAVQPADQSTVSAWRQRLLVFRQTTLADVVAEVNRYRPGKLILNREGLGAHRVQASFSLDRLDDVIALIHDAYGATVTHLPGGIVLLG